MVLCFECSQTTKSELDAMVASGEYRDISEAISAAVSNQVVLQRQVTRAGSVVIGGENAAAAELRPSDRTRDLVLLPREKERQPVRPTEPEKFGVPTLFQQAEAGRTDFEAAELPGDKWTADSEVPPEHWIWGQHNRFLPVKASCRGLAHLQQASPNGVLLGSQVGEIVEAASVLGDYLSVYDRRFDLKREDAAAVAFPNSGRVLWKTQQRFRAQFIGNLSKQGVFTGMLLDLKLVNWRPVKDDGRLCLTSAGVAFAALPNPLLDGDGKALVPRLSDEEVAFLLAHIRSAVPAEHFAYRFLLDAIANGHATPDALDDEVAALSHRVSNDAMSDAFVSTQRSGVIARMSDLGLVTRERSGQAVRYMTTERGQQYRRPS